MKKTLLSLAVIVGLFSTTNLMAADAEKAYKMDAKNELVRPTNYRTWVYVGTPVTPNELKSLMNKEKRWKHG